MLAEDSGSAADRVIDALVAHAVAHAEVGRRFARSHGMHATDAAAAVQIAEADREDVPLTPARLAARLGLTPGATSILLNRLERAGLIRRTHDQADRRVVTLHATQQMHRAAETFYLPLRTRLQDALADVPAQHLELVERTVGHVHEVIDQYLGEAADVDLPD